MRPSTARSAAPTLATRGVGLGLLVTAATLGGLLALGIDQTLNRWTAGYWVPFSGVHLLCYLLVGALGGVVALPWTRRQPPTAARRCSIIAGFTGVYLPAVADRLAHAVGTQAGLVEALMVLAAAAGMALTTVALVRISKSAITGLGLTGLAAAVGLAVNRNLVSTPTETRALVADLAIGLVVLGLAVATRRTHGGRWGFVTASLIVATITLRSLQPVPLPAPPRPEADPPDLILVVIDTLRQDVFQSVVEGTPEGAAFASRLKGAVWYSQAIAVAPWTPPSMASIFTGRYPREHGFRDLPLGTTSGFHALATAVPTLAERLRARGYYTYGIATNPVLHRDTGLLRGFAAYRHLLGPTVKLPLLTALTRFVDLKQDYYQSARQVESHLGVALDQDLASVDNPLFLWLHLMEPHHPLHPHRGLSPDPGEIHLDEDELRYRRETREALSRLVQMFDRLDQAGRWDGSLVVVVSDHGEMFPSDDHDNGTTTLVGDRPKVLGHGHALYEELVRVPLVIRPPRPLPESRTVDEIVNHTDLWPMISTLLDVDLGPARRGARTAVPWPPREDGRGRALRPPTLLSALQHGPDRIGLRTETHKLIHYPKQPGRDELYDLRRDPGEAIDLAATRPQLLRRFRVRLGTLWGELSPPPSSGEVVSDEDERARLRALGYIQ
ncbi:MAG: sulfatase-like hydrolase/transferase [Thermoanaerobaculia bacterium]|nr:sulfatase-like hydrolase/transferase [Thermoanaerobaculia bacterium]